MIEAMISQLLSLPLWVLAVHVGAIALVSSLIIRYNRLRHIPGPFVASLTNLWKVYLHYIDSSSETIIKLHDQYGSLVRTGPNSISITDPGSLSQVYSTHGEFHKADSYTPLRIMMNGASTGTIFDMQDEEQNTAIKRGIGGAFSVKNLLDYESDVDEILEALFQRIEQNPNFDLLLNLKYYQIDFLIKIAFSENAGCLSEGRDDLGLLHLGQRFVHWRNWHAMPHLENFIFQNPYLDRFLRPFTQQPARWATMGVERMKNRISSGVSQEPKDLLQKYLDASEKFSDLIQKGTIVRLINSTISAGSDTTSATLTSIIYFLIKYPHALAELRQEIDHAMASGQLSFPSKYQDVSRLKYMDAVFKENLRIHPMLTIPLEREVPVGGATIAGQFIPAGTYVGYSASAMHHNPAVFGDNLDEFRPERWLTDNEDQKRLMEKCLLSFGSGKRACLGRHIAELEIKKVIPAIVARFDMKLQNPNHVHPLHNGLLDLRTDELFVKFKKRNHV